MIALYEKYFTLRNTIHTYLYIFFFQELIYLVEIRKLESEALPHFELFFIRPQKDRKSNDVSLLMPYLNCIWKRQKDSFSYS